LLAFFAPSARGQVVRYVDDDAPGGNGQSWNDAYQNLQDALNDAAATEIRVAGGTYRPDVGAGSTNVGALALGAATSLVERCTFVGSSAPAGGASHNTSDVDLTPRSVRFRGRLGQQPARRHRVSAYTRQLIGAVTATLPGARKKQV